MNRQAVAAVAALIIAVVFAMLLPMPGHVIEYLIGLY